MLKGAACWWVLLAFAIHMGGKEAVCGKSAGKHVYAMNGNESKRACMVCKDETKRFIHVIANLDGGK
jgi:hypothetical protein